MKTKNPKNQEDGQKKTGRPPIRTTEWPTFDSLGQCSSSSGIPLSVLKDAKRSGCTAFRSNRVFVGELLPWVFEQMGQSTDWVSDAQRSDALIKRNKLAALEGQLVGKDEVVETVTKALAEMFSELDRCLVSEFPVRVVGMAEIGIRKVALEEIEKVKGNLKDKFQKLSKAEKS